MEISLVAIFASTIPPPNLMPQIKSCMALLRNHTPSALKPSAFDQSRPFLPSDMVVLGWLKLSCEVHCHELLGKVARKRRWMFQEGKGDRNRKRRRLHGGNGCVERKDCEGPRRLHVALGMRGRKTGPNVQIDRNTDHFWT